MNNKELGLCTDGHISCEYTMLTSQASEWNLAIGKTFWPDQQAKTDGENLKKKLTIITQIYFHFDLHNYKTDGSLGVAICIKCLMIIKNKFNIGIIMVIIKYVSFKELWI